MFSDSISVQKQATKVFDKYTRSIINLHKNSFHGTLYIDIEFDLKHDIAADFNDEWAECDLIPYGIKGNSKIVDCRVYDQFYTIENRIVKFEIPVENKDEVNQQNPITKKQYDLVINKFESVYFFWVDLVHNNTTDVK